MIPNVIYVIQYTTMPQYTRNDSGGNNNNNNAHTHHTTHTTRADPHAPLTHHSHKHTRTHTRTLFVHAARWSGVLPTWSSRLTSAPARIRRSTIRRCPLAEAKWSAVLPFSSQPDTSIPDDNRLWKCVWKWKKTMDGFGFSKAMDSMVQLSCHVTNN